jgi:hypothetical protein
MPEDLKPLLAQISETLQRVDWTCGDEVYKLAVKLRQLADQIQNSSIPHDLRPWWDDPAEGELISQR